jgi:hypothetical protein
MATAAAGRTAATEPMAPSFPWLGPMTGKLSKKELKAEEEAPRKRT